MLQSGEYRKVSKASGEYCFRSEKRKQRYNHVGIEKFTNRKLLWIVDHSPSVLWRVHPSDRLGSLDGHLLSLDQHQIW